MERSELARVLGAEWAGGEGADRTVIEEREPERFREKFAAAVAGGGRVFLADPGWGQAERAQFAKLVTAEGEADDERGWLMIATGGSSGRMKLARHDEVTLVAAVRGFAAHFGVARVDAVGVLPLHHVSGLLGWLRCALTGGDFVERNWAEIVAGRRPAVAGRFISVVPTQLARLLEDAAAVAWLREAAGVLVGGGPAWATLVEAGRAQGLPLVFSYWTTETAAMVTALRPGEFTAGGEGSGTALPHARIRVAADGAIEIGGESLFYGYWPERRETRAWWRPGDFGGWDAAGSLHVLGRSDDLIISGGEKVNPAEVAAALREIGADAEVTVVGVPDARWGEAVVACWPGEPRALDVAALEGKLAAFKRPKHCIAVPVGEWPRTAAGKLDRARLRGIAARLIGVDPGGEGGR